MKLPLPVLELTAPGEVAETLDAFLRHLGGPSWIRLPGRDRSRVRAMTTLLHGNEPSGVRALHRFLRSGRQPATDILALVANVPAALMSPGFTHRTLPGHGDLNRHFADTSERSEAQLSRDILATLRRVRPEALIDLHNTSGTGPAYGVGIRADPPFLALVSLFTDHYVLTDIRLGALMEVTAADFPTVTIECGGARDPLSDKTALAGIEAYFCADDAFAGDAGRLPVTVIERPLRVRLAGNATVAYAKAPVAKHSLTLRNDIDRFNSGVLDTNEPIGWAGQPIAFDVSGRNDIHGGSDLFELRAGRLYARRPLQLFMATTDAGIAVSDCLFYAVPL